MNKYIKFKANSKKVIFEVYLKDYVIDGKRWHKIKGIYFVEDYWHIVLYDDSEFILRSDNKIRMGLKK